MYEDIGMCIHQQTICKVLFSICICYHGNYHIHVHILPWLHNIPAIVLDSMFIPHGRTVLIPLVDIPFHELPILPRNYIYLVPYPYASDGILSWYDLWREYEDELEHDPPPHIEPGTIPANPIPIIQRHQPL